MSTPDETYAQGVALLDSGRLAEALALFALVLRTEPQHAATRQALRRLSRGALSNGMAAADDTPEAVLAYEQVIEAYSILGEVIEDADDREILRLACCNLAVSHHRRGRFDQAIAFYRDALLLVPGDCDTTINLSDLLMRQGRADEALQMLAPACARYPDAAGLQENLVIALYETGQAEKAVEAASRAALRFPELRFSHRSCHYVVPRGGGKLTS